jgi:peptidoglycan hydrolase FlgJ
MAQMTKADFVARFWPAAVQVTAGTGIFPEVAISQWALETGYAKSRHAQPDVNNFAGIKAGSSWTGKVISSTTDEVLNGQRQTFAGTGKIYANKAAALAAGAHPQTIFRVYATEIEGLQGWKDIIMKSIYTAARQATTPAAQFAALQAAGYATATSYASTLSSVLNGLTSYIEHSKKVLAANGGAFFFNSGPGPIDVCNN